MAAEKAARAEGCSRAHEQIIQLKGRHNRRRVLTTDDDGSQRRLMIAEHQVRLKMLKKTGHGFM